MIDITEHDVVTHWSVSPPIRVKPIATGTNNRSYRIETGQGAYVLKSYMNALAQERLVFEHAVLDVLNASGLPFAVPARLSAKSGDTSVQIEHDRNVLHASLFHLIAGHAAQFGSTSDGFRCGEALAILGQALGHVKLDPAIPAPETFGDLAAIHPSIPDPLETIRQSLDDSRLTEQIASLASVTMDRWQRQTSGWATQIIHSDFYPTNTLMHLGKITGVLDFEFAGQGYRAMDFAIGLAAFSVRSWDDGVVWPLLDAFTKGYLRRISVAEEELSATPLLLLVRELGSLVHWLGRMEQGLTTLDDICHRAQRLLTLHRWMELNQDQLVFLLLSINDQSNFQ